MNSLFITRRASPGPALVAAVEVPVSPKLGIVVSALVVVKAG